MARTLAAAALLGCTVIGLQPAMAHRNLPSHTRGQDRRSFVGPAPSATNHIFARYRALRRLRAVTASRSEGWLSAFTEFDPELGLRYRVVAEGGSSRIRDRVLRRILETESKWSAPKEALKSAMTEANYDFQPYANGNDGLLKVRVSPRRLDPRLVNGEIFVAPIEGNIVRLEGRLSKSPSFWVRWVEVVWEFRRIAGATLPVRLDSTADVRFAGRSTFTMTYDYQMVNDEPVSELDKAGAK